MCARETSSEEKKRHKLTHCEVASYVPVGTQRNVMPLHEDNVDDVEDDLNLLDAILLPPICSSAAVFANSGENSFSGLMSTLLFTVVELLLLLLFVALL